MSNDEAGCDLVPAAHLPGDWGSCALLMHPLTK